MRLNEEDGECSMCRVLADPERASTDDLLEAVRQLDQALAESERAFRGLVIAWRTPTGYVPADPALDRHMAEMAAQWSDILSRRCRPRPPEEE